MRKEFELSEAQLKKILDAGKPTPVMYASGGRPMFDSPQENANRAWSEIGKEMGFDYMTAQPVAGKANRFFTAAVTNPKLITPCPVCGAEDDCPHTPVRCQHEWDNATPVIGEARKCANCGRVERAKIAYDTVIA